jgi:hypothetical protein
VDLSSKDRRRGRLGKLTYLCTRYGMSGAGPRTAGMDLTSVKAITLSYGSYSDNYKKQERSLNDLSDNDKIQ